MDVMTRSRMMNRQRKIDAMISAGTVPGINLAKIISIDPRVYDLLERARKVKGHKDRAYISFRGELQQYVGWAAEDERLRTSDAYQTAHRALCDALKY